jgi:CubicO group peptidase (beta-lactamase class C family)
MRNGTTLRKQATIDRMPKNLKGLDPFIRGLMSKSGIPGLSIGIVEGSDVVWARGYGVAKIGAQTPVTDQTRFGIASCTKAFTAAALALLVAEGRLQWDKPLCEVVPDFRLHDEIASRCATIRDLLLHRTGVPGHDLAILSPGSRADLLRRVRHLAPSAGFRSGWQYNSTMYAVAGAVLEHVTGTSWEEFVHDRLFVPLGMRESGFSGQQPDGVPDAVGHAELREGTVPWLQPWDCGNDLCAVMGTLGRPGGGIKSSAEDLCRWLLMNLNQGQLDGQAVLPAEQVQELHRPGIVMSPILNEPEMLDASYALGWICQPYRGQRFVHHWGGGAGEGTTSFISFMPDRKLGVAVLTNIEKPPLLPTIIALNAYDRLLGLEPISWARRWGGIMRWMEAAFKAQQEPSQCKGRKMSPTARKAVVGDYHHPGYGWIHVCGSAGQLELRFNSFRFAMRHCGDGVFDLVPRVPLTWWGQRQARCQAAGNGQVQSIVVPFEPAVPDLAFQRRDGNS